MQSVAQGLADLRSHVDKRCDNLSEEIHTLSEESNRGRSKMHERLNEIERTGARRLTDLEVWKAKRENSTASADTAAMAVQKPAGKWETVRDVLRQPAPWISLGVVLIVLGVLLALVAPAALDALAQATARRIIGG